MDEKIIIVDGNNFSDMESFYNEIDRILTKGLDWQAGHNLNAFNDLLCGGFGVYEYEESIVLIWKNTAKSKVDLGFEATKNWYKQKLAENKTDNQLFFRDELNNLNKNIGQSLFDIIIEIISRQKHIQFQMED